MEPVTTALTIAVTAEAAKVGLSSVIEFAASVAKGPLKAKIKEINNRRAIDRLYSRIRQVRMVKTIWSIEKKIDLQKFYYPPDVETQISVVRAESIEVLFDSDNKHAVIQGTVGQGKSILLRYLCSKEMQRGKSLPIFLELRAFTSADSLVSMLIEEAESLGLDLDETEFCQLAEHGLVSLFLDGFDEIPDRNKSRAVAELESLCKRYPKSVILVTGRPDSGIESSGFFEVLPICGIDEEDVERYIHNMCDSGLTAKKIIGGLNRSEFRIRELLTTPLMIALLVLHYSISRDVPTSEVEFFGDLFDILVRRHDKTKPGYKRERSSGLADSELRRFFDCLSFLIKKADDGSLSRPDFIKYSNQSVVQCGLQCKPDSALDDIIKITCLLLEDGSEIRYVHRSVMEFHAAQYVADQDDERAKKFYVTCKTKWSLWYQELCFLRLIDSSRHAKFFYCDSIAQSISLLQAMSVTKDFVRSALMTDYVIIRYLAPLNSWTLENRVYSISELRAVLSGQHVSVRVGWGHNLGSRSSISITESESVFAQAFALKNHVLIFRRALRAANWLPASDLLDTTSTQIAAQSPGLVSIKIDLTNMSSITPIGRIVLDSLRRAMLDLERDLMRCSVIAKNYRSDTDIFDVS